MDRRPPPPGYGQGIPGFAPGFSPGTFKKMFIYFTVPIAIGFGLLSVTNRWSDGVNEEVRQSNPKMVKIIDQNSKEMFGRVKADNEKFLDEFWGRKKSDEKEKKQEK